ncbi:MAG: membrane lipoprotein lipid attachment site-containing protein [Alphaproteobacteria bacterium]|nr:membrane lipoprotein lipid attachment site-containing protein [Alphaproteobacteria bacterium]
MKKVLFAFLGLIVLSGCSSYFDYYKGGVRYTQDGDDCIFYAAERGRHYSDDIRALDVDKKIVYKNTMCRDLYVRDNMGVPSRTERAVLTPAKKPCGCAKKCGKKKYVFVK